MKENDTFKKDVDYYMEDGRLVFTEHYLTKIRKYCCGNGCRHCCFTPANQKGNTQLKSQKIKLN